MARPIPLNSRLRGVGRTYRTAMPPAGLPAAPVHRPVRISQGHVLIAWAVMQILWMVYVFLAR